MQKKNFAEKNVRQKRFSPKIFKEKAKKMPKILRTWKMLKFQKSKNIGSLTGILLVLIKKKGKD